jgi:hypothetical protein
MSKTNTHPLYAEFQPDWEKMEDCYRGEHAIKEKGLLYLPATPGQLIDGMDVGKDGYKNYCAYKLRARFPDFVAQAIEAMLGTLHRKPPTIQLPAKMKSLLERATIRGESMNMLLRRINLNQLKTGRLGLLADVPDGASADVLPYVVMYDADDILNWDDRQKSALEMAVVDESTYVRTDALNWEYVEQYRVLMLENGRYHTALFKESFNQESLLEPSLAGRSLSQLPFVIVNSKDIVADPDDPPLLGLAELALSVYKGEADYRQALFMQGQDTLVVVGGVGQDGDVRAGAGARIEVGMGGDAKYIGVSSGGVPEMRTALENDRQEAAEIGGRLLDTTGRKGESGESLRIRVSARTASLNQIALSGAEGLQTILRIIAEWVGSNPAEVIVTPNMDFANDTIDGTTLVEYMTAKNLGAPLSIKSIHALLKDRELTKLTYEEEMAEIDSEPLIVGPGSTNKAGPDGQK